MPTEDRGLVRDGHHLLWGMDHGHLRWAPYWLRSAIVTVWNHVACTVYGHGILIEEQPDLPHCTSCCRNVSLAQAKEYRVLRLWGTEWDKEWDDQGEDEEEEKDE